MTTPSPTTPEMVEKLDDAIARVVRFSACVAYRSGRKCTCSMSEFPDVYAVDSHCYKMEQVASAAIQAHTQALEEVGYVIAPREPTDAMLQAGLRANTAVSLPDDVWPAMVNEARK